MKDGGKERKKERKKDRHSAQEELAAVVQETSASLFPVDNSSWKEGLSERLKIHAAHHNDLDY